MTFIWNCVIILLEYKTMSCNVILLSATLIKMQRQQTGPLLSYLQDILYTKPSQKMQCHGNPETRTGVHLPLIRCSQEEDPFWKQQFVKKLFRNQLNKNHWKAKDHFIANFISDRASFIITWIFVSRVYFHRIINVLTIKLQSRQLRRHLTNITSR